MLRARGRLVAAGGRSHTLRTSLTRAALEAASEAHTPLTNATAGVIPRGSVCSSPHGTLIASAPARTLRASLCSLVIGAAATHRV